MKLNITIEVENKQEVSNLVYFIEQYSNVIDWSILTDTSKMYKEDSFFRGLANSLKKSKRVYNDYVNENN